MEYDCPVVPVYAFVWFSQVKFSISSEGMEMAHTEIFLAEVTKCLWITEASKEQEGLQESGKGMVWKLHERMKIMLPKLPALRDTGCYELNYKIPFHMLKSQPPMWLYLERATQMNKVFLISQRGLVIAVVLFFSLNFGMPVIKIEIVLTFHFWNFCI